MKIKDLKQGNTFYDVSFTGVTRYDYLCVYPTNNKYHILINKSDEQPIRVYEDKLQKLIEKNICTYDEAKKARIKFIEDHLIFLKQLYEFNE